MKRRAFNRSLLQKLGRRISRRRKELGLTQRGLTKLADMSSQRQVWDIEHGLTGMNVETARRVAKALDWSLSQLFEGL
jgi:transcriptional regulator with XRE-family HTH domain